MQGPPSLPRISVLLMAESFWEQVQAKKAQMSVRDRPSGQVERTKDLESENQKASPALSLPSCGEVTHLSY